MPITVGNTASSGALTGGTSNILALNNNKEDVIVCVSIRDTRTAATATVTYAGAALTPDVTLLYQDDNSTLDLRVYIFRKTAAAAGINNIVVTLNNAADRWTVIALCAASLHATQPEDTDSASDAAENATDPITTLSTSTPDCLLVDCLYDKTATNLVAGSGQTIIAQIDISNDRALAGYKIVNTAGSKPSTYTNADEDDWCMASVAYKIASSPIAITIPTANLSLSGQTPTIGASDNKNIAIPAQSGLAFSSLDPSVALTDHENISVPSAALAFTPYAPDLKGYGISWLRSGRATKIEGSSILPIALSGSDNRPLDLRGN